MGNDRLGLLSMRARIPEATGRMQSPSTTDGRVKIDSEFMSRFISRSS